MTDIMHPLLAYTAFYKTKVFSIL